MGSPYSSATQDAGESLYHLIEIFEQVSLSNGKAPDEINDARNVLVSVIKRLCAYAASGDHRVSLEEDSAVGAIFWQDTDIEIDYEPFLKGSQSGLEVNIADLQFLKSVMSAIAKARHQASGEPYCSAKDLMVSSITLVLQTVIAADHENPLELSRISEVSSKLRRHALQVEMDLKEGNESSSPSSHPSLSNYQTQLPSVSVHPRSYEECLTDLHRLIGLDNIKREVENLANLAKIFKLRRDMQLPVPDLSFHLVFSGSPGTGKSSVARIIAGVYRALGLIKAGQLVEVDRSGLVGNYVGQTATKTQEAISSSIGGVLFIDEAYALAERGNNDYGQEAIETILKAMEDRRDELIVIAAGYPIQMENFLNSNPGLRSRFTRTLHFQNYNEEEMVEIFIGLAAQGRYNVTSDARAVLPTIMHELLAAKGSSFANARDVRNLFEQALSQQANRLAGANSLTANELSDLIADDLRTGSGVGC